MIDFSFREAPNFASSRRDNMILSILNGDARANKFMVLAYILDSCIIYIRDLLTCAINSWLHGMPYRILDLSFIKLTT